MLKQVQHDTMRELLVGECLTAALIPFLPPVGKTSIEHDRWQGDYRL
jgi:hypothetical protein